MADIKTRKKKSGTIKAIDKAAIAAMHRKDSYAAAKVRAKENGQESDGSAGEYAIEKTLEVGKLAAGTGIRQWNRQGKKAAWAVKEEVEGQNAATGKMVQGAAWDTTEQRKRISEPAIPAAVRRRRAARAWKPPAGALADGAPTDRVIKRDLFRNMRKGRLKNLADGAVKMSGKSVKTAQATARAAVKTTEQAAKISEGAKKTEGLSTGAAHRMRQAAKALAERTLSAAKRTEEAAVIFVRIAAGAAKGFLSAILAGSWLVVALIVLISFVGLLAGSAFGIFFSGEASGNGMTMQSAVREINREYDNRLEEIIEETEYDRLEMSGSRAEWKEVLAVYAVKATTDEECSQDVATMDEGRKRLLAEIFWEMNEISSRTEDEEEVQVTESDDGHGNIVQTEDTVAVTYLYITVSHKNADEMADRYGFDEAQRRLLSELLDEERTPLWSQVIYGTGAGERDIVAVALSQVGNAGGQTYWSWYGFAGRVEWCACFVSWCANECGYIDSGIIPKFSGCVNGAKWFRERGQWKERGYEPSAGQLIFFDGNYDGVTDHVGIVEKCENGIVYTIEGNCGDACRQQRYAVGDSRIYGYGILVY